ncbi:MAG: hypothetical protein MHPSP_002088 [Paramarteilia canceri]
MQICEAARIQQGEEIPVTQEEIRKIHNLHQMDVILMIWMRERIDSLRHHHLLDFIGFTKSINAYIQTRILKRTLDSFLECLQRICPDLAETNEVVVCDESNESIEEKCT